MNPARAVLPDCEVKNARYLCQVLEGYRWAGAEVRPEEESRRMVLFVVADTVLVHRDGRRSRILFLVNDEHLRNKLLVDYVLVTGAAPVSASPPVGRMRVFLQLAGFPTFGCRHREDHSKLLPI